MPRSTGRSMSPIWEFLRPIGSSWVIGLVAIRTMTTWLTCRTLVFWRRTGSAALAHRWPRPSRPRRAPDKLSRPRYLSELASPLGGHLTPSQVTSTPAGAARDESDLYGSDPLTRF